MCNKNRNGVVPRRMILYGTCVQGMSCQTDDSLGFLLPLNWRHMDFLKQFSPVLLVLYIGVTIFISRFGSKTAYPFLRWKCNHYNGVIIIAMASQITSLTIVCSTVCSSGDQIKHQSSASLGFVRGIRRWPVNSPHKWPVTRKMSPFDDVIMILFIPNNHGM